MLKKKKNMFNNKNLVSLANRLIDLHCSLKEKIQKKELLMNNQMKNNKKTKKKHTINVLKAKLLVK